MPLAKNASWKLICHLNALFVSQWKLKSSCTHVWHDKRLKNCLNRARKKLFEKLSSKRLSISVFIFENHYAVFFLVKISWQSYQLSSKKVYFFSYLSVICVGMRKSESSSLQALSLFPRCKA